MRLTLPPVIVATVFAAGCSTLPEKQTRVDAESQSELTTTLENLARAPAASLAFCETVAQGRQCDAESRGLKAAGLGGVFLPLDATLTRMSLRAGQADFDMSINGIPASCATAPVELNDSARSLTASGFYCNWAGIGNVLATVQLTADWQAGGADIIGGRYLLRFNGTGNGAGAGTFRADLR